MLTDLVLVEAENPFANDLLDREAFVTNLKKILIGGNRGIVLGLNGAWGTGKTTCIQFLQQDLIKSDHVVIVLNAWADDYITDPLVAIIASLVEDENFKRLITNKRLIERLTSVGKNVLTFAAQLGVSRVSRGALTSGDVGAVFQVKTDYSEILTQYADEKKALEALRSVLIDISNFLKEKDNKKLIFIVDELDRCKPTYAISLFERIKHVLEVNDLRVLLSFDQKQLEATVQKHYGATIDATRYLEKMFDVIINLPPSNLKRLFRKTINSLDLPINPTVLTPPYRPGSVDELLEMLLNLLMATQASAREVQRTLTRVNFLWSRDGGLRIDPVFAVVLLILRSHRQDIFEKVLNGSSSFFEIDSFFKNFTQGVRYWSAEYQNYIETLYYLKQDFKLDGVDLSHIAIESQAFSQLSSELQAKRQRMQAYISGIRNDSIGTLREMALAVDLVIS